MQDQQLTFSRSCAASSHTTHPCPDTQRSRMEWEKKMWWNPLRGEVGRKGRKFFLKKAWLGFFFLSSPYTLQYVLQKPVCTNGTCLLVNLHNGSVNQPKNIQYSTSHFYFTLTAKCRRLKNIRNSTLNEIFFCLLLLQISYKKRKDELKFHAVSFREYRYSSSLSRRLDINSALKMSDTPSIDRSV